MSGRRRVAVCHPGLGRGGSEARALWAIEALKGEYDVTLLTTGKVDLKSLNSAYCTSLLERDLRVVAAPLPVWLRTLRGGDALKGSYFLRFCRSVAHKFDVLVSAYNLMDVGMPAIHFVADFSWNRTIRERYDPAPGGHRGWFHKNPLLLKAYQRFCQIIAPASRRSLLTGDDVIVANSRWTAAILKKEYGVDTPVVYPPVAAEFTSRALGEREAGAVCIGRISPEKRIERMIEIIHRVRKTGQDMDLHIIGDVQDDAYGRGIRELAEARGKWVKLEGACFGERKADLLAGHLVGLHARPGEAFGIAVAEMVKAGCLTFVPEDSAASEIVNHSQLTYGSIDDAVKKICEVLKSRSTQEVLQAHLALQAECFSVAEFREAVRRLVGNFNVRRNAH